LHQLVSSQLDMDRMDYLNRDSFFTGVSEGVISSDRIIKMLNVKDNGIAVEEKGIYSIEKFLISRRLMYWQVYLHKTVIAAEQLLCKIFKRSRELALAGVRFPVTPALGYFLENVIRKEDFISSSEHLDTFALLDDTDVMAAVKIWADSKDFVLKTLCHNLINRKLFHVDITAEMPDLEFVKQLTANAVKYYNISPHEAEYFVFTDSIRNNAYNKGDGNIHILMKNGSIKDITLASDNSNLEALSKTVSKYILCYSKDLL
jgi:HD superfamily phosphohydrolase